MTTSGLEPRDPASPSKSACPQDAGLEASTQLVPTRRSFLGIVTKLMALAVTSVLAIPAVGYVLTPLFKRKEEQGGFVTLARLSDLEPGVPRVFPVVQGRKDAWVSYPPEPVGSVWLVRNSKDSSTQVVAFTAECPHLACAITLSDDHRGFFCPCHVSSFRLDGARINGAAPRDMDPLEVEPLKDGDPDTLIRVRFQRFRTNTEARIPLA